jgi:hypothetical protein
MASEHQMANPVATLNTAIPLEVGAYSFANLRQLINRQKGLARISRLGFPKRERPKAPADGLSFASSCHREKLCS